MAGRPLMNSAATTSTELVDLTQGEDVEKLQVPDPPQVSPLRLWEIRGTVLAVVALSKHDVSTFTPSESSREMLKSDEAV